METVEEDLLGRSLADIEEAHKAGKPFFLWHNSTRNHVWINLSDKWKNKTGYGEFADGMAELDYVTGKLLDKLDELGIADKTIVVFSTDNGRPDFSGPAGRPLRVPGFKVATNLLRWLPEIPMLLGGLVIKRCYHGYLLL